MTVLKQLLASKKAVAALVAVVVWAGGRLGLDLTTVDLALPIGAIIAFVLSQGWADHGKEAVKEQAKLTTFQLGTPDGSAAETGPLPKQASWQEQLVTDARAARAVGKTPPPGPTGQ